MQFLLLKLFLFFFIFSSHSNAEIQKVFEFTGDELKDLKVRKIKNETKYSVETNENGNLLKAVSDGTASGLGKEIIINLVKKIIYHHLIGEVIHQLVIVLQLVVQQHLL